MPSAAHRLRLQIEAALADRIPSALTPVPRVIRPTAPTGIAALDKALGGGFPLGAISELAGPECSGRTSLALSFIAGFTSAGQVCAWVDVSDTLHPESAAAAGVDLSRLLWIRCGPAAEKLVLPGWGDEQRQGKIQESRSGQSQKKVSISVTNSPTNQNFAPRCAEPQRTVRKKSREAPAKVPVRSGEPQALPPAPRTLYPASQFQTSNSPRKKSWSRLDQALRATDLLVQAGGFAAIVLDMGSVAPEFALRVPLATWFRYRAAAERTQASMILLTQQACTKSSAALVLHCLPGSVAFDSATVFTGVEFSVEIARERFAKVTEFTRKPPQSDHSVLHSGNSLRWQTQTLWASTHVPRPQKSGRS